MSGRYETVARNLVRRLSAGKICARGRVPTARQRPEGTARQLLVDVSVIYRHDARTGIQRVVRALLLQLLHNPIPGYELKPVFATRSEGYRHACPDFLDGRDREGAPVAPVETYAGDIFVGLDLAANLLPRHCEQIACWKNHGTAVHIVVYDLLPVVQGHWFHRRTRRHFRRWLDFIAEYADGVICISDQVIADFHRYLALRHSKSGRVVRVSRIGLSGDVRSSAPSKGLPIDAGAFCRFLRTGPVTLMIGTVEPRKGYDRALAAFELIWREEPEIPRRLVIVGKPGWKTNGLQKKLREHPEAGKRLFWLDDASDEFVELLYQLCTGVLVTSYAEGYGLPVMEACAHDKPVLARDLPVFREFEHPGIQFFADDRSQALADSIRAWLDGAGRLVTLPGALHLPDWTSARRDLLTAIDIALPGDPIEPEFALASPIRKARG